MEAIVRDLIGKPFQDGGRGPVFFDCYGLVIEVYKRIGIELPDYPIRCSQSELIHGQIQEAKQIWRKCDFNNPPSPSVITVRTKNEFVNHTGAYIGSGKFLHIMEKTGVILTSTNHPYWAKRVEGYYVPGWL